MSLKLLNYSEVRFVRAKEAIDILSISRTTLYRLVRSGRLSAPRTISPGVKVYPLNEILALLTG